ncbi:MAG: twin-arginine translocase subunit TatC [Thermodesulfovibrionales bacterium]|nr:twin-arginine translocase subunit TatC [Thermodesulfovibrionales bacterium]
MPLTEHLGELRKRIITSLVALIITFSICFAYSEYLFKFVMFPLNYELDFSVKKMYFYFAQKDKLQTTKLVFLAPAEAFWMSIKLSLVSGFTLALPVLFHQFWKFVSPGLLPKERKYAVPFIFTTTFLFLVGASFCFFIVLPYALSFLLSYNTGGVLMPMLSVGQYVDFCLKFILSFGAVFELPVLIFFLTRFGIISTETLISYRRHSILFAFILAAFLTPTPDAFNQTLMAIPIILLYEVGIWVSKIFNKKRDDEEETEGK